MNDNFYRTSYMLINLDQLETNFRIIKEECSPDKFLYAVVKGDGYGHGILEMTQLAINTGIDGIAVATLDEGLLVRRYFPDVKILCLGIIDYQDIFIAAQEDITITIANFEFIEFLTKLGLTYPLSLHIKVNTGMNRIGFNKYDDVKKALDLLNDIDNITVDGIFTHFATAEFEDESYLLDHIEIFKKMIDNLDYEFNQIHCTNSASLLKMHDKLTFTNTNRVGIALYGALDHPIQEKYHLKSALSLVTSINSINKYDHGTKIGYNNAYVTSDDIEYISTLPIGYADVPFLENEVLLKTETTSGHVVGNVCMDQIMARFDEKVKMGDLVKLIDPLDSEMNVVAYARARGVIPHQILTSLTARLPRLYLRDNDIITVRNDLIRYK
jgi:alanine racemase